MYIHTYYIYIHVYTCIYTLKRPRKKLTNPAPMSIPITQLVVLKYHFSPKEMRASWKNSLERKCKRQAWDILLKQKPLLTTNVISKWLRRHLKRPPLCKHGRIWSWKDNNCLLEPIINIFFKNWSPSEDDGISIHYLEYGKIKGEISGIFPVCTAPMGNKTR